MSNAMPVIKSDVSDVFGANRRFEFIDVVERGKSKYALFLPLQGGDDLLEVVILAVNEPCSCTINPYRSVTDHDELMSAYAAFCERDGGKLGLVNVA